MSESPLDGRAVRRACLRWLEETSLIVGVATIVAATATPLAATPALGPVPGAPASIILQPVPPIDASAMEPAVRQQVEAARRQVAGAAALPAAEAATIFGEAGRTFSLYLLLDAAMPCFENAAALAPQDFRWAYYAGVTARTRGDLDRARAHFRRALALRSPFPAALVRLGELEILGHDLESANRDYTAALAFPGTAAAAHFGLGRVALLRGDARLAAEHFEAALAAQPEASIVHAQLAIAYRRLGQIEKAAAQAAAHGDMAVRFDDALASQVQKGDIGNSNRIAGARQALGEGRFAEAAGAFRQAAGVDPQDVRAWVGLGDAQQRLGDAGGAERSFRRAVEVAPQNPHAHLKLGTILALRGARREAIAELQTAVRLRPDFKDARFNLATALAQEGRLAEAAAECDALLQLAPQDREARALRDQLRADLGTRQPGKAESPPPPPPR
ncbi:MAG TPA: tetratricopeptide repeat protein [Thermoanaerobaculia bacterium]|nr:tetratricopeptide repeat protein [Thermoanaerobaculia bacterium]